MKKNIINLRNILLATTSVLVLALGSCTKGFEEMNKNPMSPTGTDIGPLFNGVVQSLCLNSNEQFYLWNEIFYPETELGALTSEAWGNMSIGIDAVWNNYYLALANIHDIDKRLDEMCATAEDDEIDDKVRAQLTVLEAYKTFKVTDMFGDIPYSEAGYIWYNTVENRKPKYDSQESIYKTLLEELVWAREVLINGKTTTELGNAYYSLGSHDVLFKNDYNKWGKVANSIILRQALRMYDRDEVFAGAILVEAYDKPVIDDYYYMGGAFALWPQYLGSYFGDEGWAFREHKNLRMGETVFAQMSTPTDSADNQIFDPRVYVFFDTNQKGAWRAYPQLRDANTPTEGGTPYNSSRDNNYEFKGPACLYSPFNFYLIRDHVFVPQILISPAEICFIKAELAARGIAGNDFDKFNYLDEGVKYSLLLWMQLPYNGADATYKYIYSDLQNMMKDTDIYSFCQKHYFDILNPLVYNNPNFGWTNEEFLDVIYQQRWLDLFRQPNEAWNLARRTFRTPTTIDHQKLVTYRLPYPQFEATYNYDNYSAQVKKMGGSDSRDVKVWWMEKESIN